jgi:hypothetical protein
VSNRSKAALFDHVIGGNEQLVGHGQPESPCGLVVDDELERRGLQDRQIAGLRPFDDAAGIETGLTISVPNVSPIAVQAANVGIFTPGIDRRQPVMRCKLDQLDTPAVEEGIVADEESVRPFECKRRECGVDLRHAGA